MDDEKFDFELNETSTFDITSNYDGEVQLELNGESISIKSLLNGLGTYEGFKLDLKIHE